MPRENMCTNLNEHVRILIAKILVKQYPYLGASPVLIVECTCCGKGVVEIKCPSCGKSVAEIKLKG